MSLAKLQILNYELTLQQGEISQQPLLIPIIFRLDEKQFEQWQKQNLFSTKWFWIHWEWSPATPYIKQSTSYFTYTKFTKCVVSQLAEHLENMPDFLTALCQTLEMKPIQVLADAVSLLSETDTLTK